MENAGDSLGVDVLGLAGYEVALLPAGSILVTGKGAAKEFPDWSYISPRGKTGTMNMDELRGMAILPKAPRKRLFEDDSPAGPAGPVGPVGAGAGSGAELVSKKFKVQLERAEREHMVYSFGDAMWYVEPDVEEVHIDMNPGRYFIGDFKYIRELTSFAQDAKQVFDEEDYDPYSGYFYRTRNRGSFYVTTISEGGSFFATNGFSFQLDRHISIVDTRLFSDEELKSNHTNLPGVFVSCPKGLCVYLSEEGAVQISDYSGALRRFSIVT
jgi:hypothetical protein